MELKGLIRKRIEENVPDYDITKVERYEYLFKMIAIEFATEQVKLFSQPAVSGSLPYPKVYKLLSALNDIRNWDDDLEDKWEDPGYRAKAALVEYYKGNDR